MLVVMRAFWAVILAVLTVTAAAGAPAAAAAATPAPSLAGWRWPVAAATIVEPYRAPAHRYGPGHRGIDLAAPTGSDIVAPAAGVVAFAGRVADRPLVTIDHGGGLVSTLEPVAAAVAIGTLVASGDVVGTGALGGHSAPDTVHFGVREDGEYINPMILLGGVPRAILLPCC